MKKEILKTAFAVTALAVSLAAQAQPTLFITDGVTTAGPITGGGGSVLYNNPSFGDNWSVVISSGATKPLFGSATSPNMDLTVQAISTGPGNSLTILFSDNGFGPALGSFTALLDSHVVSGSGDAMSFNTYYDAGNAVLALTTPLTSSGPLSGNNSGATFPGGTISANPFSLTEVVTLGPGVGNGVTYSVNATLQSLSPPPNLPLVRGDTATIGFWHNKNGQALIKSLNGGPNSTALGTWLASNYGCLFGSLNGKANTVVAAQFLVYFGVSGQKTYAQIMGAALASYATSSTLAGGTMAAGYGFNVSSAGTGAKTYNVGSNGSAIGLVNNMSYTVSQLLQAANANCSGGTIAAGAFNALNNIFDGINSSGDI
jgi:hypothetical protein